MSTVGAILAGGRSRRFGSDKAGAALGTRTLLERAVETLRESLPGAELVVISPDPGHELPGTSRIGDLRADRGPLAGMEAALGYARARGSDGVFVLACDLPLVTARVVRAVLDAAGAERAVAPARRGVPGFEPLCAFYRSDCAEEATRLLDDGHSAAQELLAEVGGRTLELGMPGVFTNVNTPADLDDARERLGRALPRNADLDPAPGGLGSRLPRPGGGHEDDG